jgi:hypothetical protein
VIVKPVGDAVTQYGPVDVVSFSGVTTTTGSLTNAFSNVNEEAVPPTMLSTPAKSGLPGVLLRCSVNARLPRPISPVAVYPPPELTMSIPSSCMPPASSRNPPLLMVMAVAVIYVRTDISTPLIETVVTGPDVGWLTRLLISPSSPFALTAMEPVIAESPITITLVEAVVIVPEIIQDVIVSCESASHAIDPSPTPTQFERENP